MVHGLEFRKAAAQGDFNTINKLYDADPNVLNSQGTDSGQTALHRAAQAHNENPRHRNAANYIKIIEFLLQRPTVQLLPDKAQRYPEIPLACSLAKRGALQRQFHHALSVHDYRQMRELEKYETSVVNSQDPLTGNTALIKVAAIGDLEGFMVLTSFPELDIQIVNDQEEDVWDYLLKEPCYTFRDKLDGDVSRLMALTKLSSEEDFVEERQALQRLQQLSGYSSDDLINALKACRTAHAFSAWFSRYKVAFQPNLTLQGCPLLIFIFNQFKHLDEEYLKVCDFLIKNKFSLNQKCDKDSLVSFENTLLHFTLANEHYNLFVKIISLAETNKHPIDYTIQDGEGKTLLHLAVKLRKKEMVSYILMKMKEAKLSPQDIAAIINDSGCYGIPLIHIAAIFGGVEIFQLLKENGTDLNKKDKYGRDLFSVLQSTDNDLRADLLLRSVAIDPGRDIHASNNFFRDPLTKKTQKGEFVTKELYEDKWKIYQGRLTDKQEKEFLSAKNKLIGKSFLQMCQEGRQQILTRQRVAQLSA